MRSIEKRLKELEKRTGIKKYKICLVRTIVRRGARVNEDSTDQEIPNEVIKKFLIISNGRTEIVNESEFESFKC